MTEALDVDAMHRAILGIDSDIAPLVACLDSGGDPNTLGGNFRFAYPIHQAMRSHNLTALRLLIERGASPYTAESPNDPGYCHLSVVGFHRGDCEALEVLLETCVDLTVLESLEPHGFVQACVGGPEVLRTLFRCGYRPDLYNPFENIPDDDDDDDGVDSLEGFLRGASYGPESTLVACVPLLASVTAAGGWKGYYYAPHKDMLVLRELCHRGRATTVPRTPELVARLFAAAPRLGGAVDTRRRTRRARALEISRTQLPAPLFFIVLQYWLGTPFVPWVAPGG